MPLTRLGILATTGRFGTSTFGALNWGECAKEILIDRRGTNRWTIVVACFQLWAGGKSGRVHWKIAGRTATRGAVRLATIAFVCAGMFVHVLATTDRGDTRAFGGGYRRVTSGRIQSRCGMITVDESVTYGVLIATIRAGRNGRGKGTFPTIGATLTETGSALFARPCTKTTGRIRAGIRHARTTVGRWGAEVTDVAATGVLSTRMGRRLFA